MRILALCLLVLCLGGCAEHHAGGDAYGFFSGIWHGLILPYALFAKLLGWVAALFDYKLFQSVELVGRPNSGLMYYFGMLIGLAAYAGTTAASNKVRE